MKEIVFTLSFVFGLHAVVSAADLIVAAPERKAVGVLPTPSMPTNSAVQLFRQLLALNPQARAQALAAKTPAARQVLEARLSEFESLLPPDRELRLRQLQLRAYLIPLMHTPASNRVVRLAVIPLDDRKLVEDRLRVWDIMPPALRQEVLENETVLHYIFPLESPTLAQPQISSLQGLSPQQREKLDKDIARLRALSPDEREKNFDRTRRFFELNNREKEKILATAGQSQQEQLAKTLRAFQQLPRPQRDLCMEGVSKFTQLTPEERLQFLHNCERWQAMTPEQQTALRAAITRVAPRPPMPPLPKGLTGYPSFFLPLQAHSVSLTNVINH